MKTDLLTIPNVGRRTKEAMMNIGISCVEDLIGQDPEDLYARDCLKKVFRRTDVLFMFLEWQCIMLSIPSTTRKN